MQGLMTARQVAKYLHVRVETIRRWVAIGRIPEIAITRRVRRFQLADVRKALRIAPIEARKGGSHAP